MMLQWCAHSEHWATAQCSFKAIQKARMYAYSKKCQAFTEFCVPNLRIVPCTCAHNGALSSRPSITYTHHSRLYIARL
jgi:hypothetical protein